MAERAERSTEYVEPGGNDMSFVLGRADHNLCLLLVPHLLLVSKCWRSVIDRRQRQNGASRAQSCPGLSADHQRRAVSIHPVSPLIGFSHKYHFSDVLSHDG